MSKTNSFAMRVPLSKLRESPTNPRKIFGDAGLKELASNIKLLGILQPLLVRETADGLEVVCGHRRLRAAKLAGLKEVPVVIRELDDRTALEVQIAENMERKDLTPLEQADALERLRGEFGYTLKDIAERLDKAHGWVAEMLTLGKLIASARKALAAERIDYSTAVLIARLGNDRLQAIALERATTPNSKGDTPSFREFKAWVDGRFKDKVASRKARGDASPTDRARVMNAVVNRATHAIEGRRDLEAFEFRLMVSALGDQNPDVLERRNIGSPEALARVLSKMDAAEIRAVAFELAIVPWLENDTDGKRLDRTARAYGASVKEIERDLGEQDRVSELKERAETLFSGSSEKRQARSTASRLLRLM